MINKLREDGGIGLWEEYEVIRRKYELDSEYWSVRSWKGNLGGICEGLGGESKYIEFIEVV